MTMDAPPSYRRLSRQGPVPPSSNAATDLPAYSRRQHTTSRTHTPQPHSSRSPTTEHTFELTDSKGKSSGTVLKLFSSAKSSKSLPKYYEKERITGTLTVNAERGDSSIQAITATVTGSIISGASTGESFVFLHQSLPIWSKSLDSPRVPSPSEGASSTKLHGRCEWPLSITLPRSVEVPSGAGDTRVFRLPETFVERYTSVSIQYELSIVISRGKLRSNNMIRTAFGYVPQTRPEPQGVLRQLVYQENLPIPDPSTDPEGWKTLRPVSVQGCMFKSRPVETRCTLSLSRPLCYTRGSVLPCFLTLEGRESPILDVLGCPSAVVVKLRRRVRFYNRATSTRKEMAWNETIEDVGTAVWWQPQNTRCDVNTRCLEGEIRLSKDLRPTSEIAHFSVSYSVVLCPFKAANYSSDSAALISEPVEIATLYAKGPRPNAYAPPAYDGSSSSTSSSSSSRRAATANRSSVYYPEPTF